jgi:hypothetical protein
MSEPSGSTVMAVGLLSAATMGLGALTFVAVLAVMVAVVLQPKPVEPDPVTGPIALLEDQEPEFREIPVTEVVATVVKGKDQPKVPDSKENVVVAEAPSVGDLTIHLEAGSPPFRSMEVTCEEGNFRKRQDFAGGVATVPDVPTKRCQVDFKGLHGARTQAVGGTVVDCRFSEGVSECRARR